MIALMEMASPEQRNCTNMKDEEFKIYDPFRRQRKKRTGVANDFVKIYQEHVDMPMVA
jgi:hypothetical protein